MVKKQQLKLEQLGVSTVFYYENGIITVCLLRQGKQILARGVAVCSPLDQFVKRTGRAKALGMALRAISRQMASGDMQPLRFGVPRMGHPLWEAHKSFPWRSDYMPILTDREKAILSRRGENGG